MDRRERVARGLDGAHPACRRRRPPPARAHRRARTVQRLGRAHARTASRAPTGSQSRRARARRATVTADRRLALADRCPVRTTRHRRRRPAARPARCDRADRRDDGAGRLARRVPATPAWRPRSSPRSRCGGRGGRRVAGASRTPDAASRRRRRRPHDRTDAVQAATQPDQPASQPATRRRLSIRRLRSSSAGSGLLGRPVE